MSYISFHQIHIIYIYRTLVCTSYFTLDKQFGDEHVERFQFNALRILEDKPMITAESVNIRRSWLPW